MEVQILIREAAILRVKRGQARTCLDMSGGPYTPKKLSRRQHGYGTDADWSVLDWSHIGATLLRPLFPLRSSLILVVEHTSWHDNL